MLLEKKKEAQYLYVKICVKEERATKSKNNFAKLFSRFRRSAANFFVRNIYAGILYTRAGILHTNLISI